jgi:hypothetical protein
MDARVKPAHDGRTCRAIHGQPPRSAISAIDQKLDQECGVHEDRSLVIAGLDPAIHRATKLFTG